jgi:phage major head subunit gpT-like protein
MEITTKSLESVKRGFQRIFDASYQGVADMWWQQLALRTTSTGSEEEYHWLGAVPGLKELIGEPQIQNLIRHGFTIKNREWEDTIGIQRKDLERDKLGVYTPLVQAMAEAAAYQPGELVAELLVNGFSKKDYTGKNFFDTGKAAHPKAKPFDNISGNKKLSQANFRIARANLTGRLNAEGRAMRLGKDLLLVVSPTYQSTALEITTAEKLGNNTNIDRGTARTLVLPELLALNAEHHWFLLEVGSPMKPFIVQTELSPETAMCTDPDDSHVIKTKQFLYQVYARHNAGYGLPELAFGSTGANAA